MLNGLLITNDGKNLFTYGHAGPFCGRYMKSALKKQLANSQSFKGNSFSARIRPGYDQLTKIFTNIQI